MRQLKFIMSISLIIILFACKDRYNEAIAWMDGIEIGTSIAEVKFNQPDYLKILWSNPSTSTDSLDEKTYQYLIYDIDGSHDILNMQHFLVFKNGKYEGRESHK